NPGVQGLMIGRGVFEDPFCFRKRGKESERRKAAEDNVTAAISSDDLCHSSPRLLPQRKNESLELLSYHLELFEGDLREAEREGRRLPFEPMKQFFKIYIRGYRGSGELRAKLMGCKDVEGAKVVLKEVE
ncbi:hypothetical protein FWH09_03245, partial [Candidatus Saccharibacteria bacterium]|nr:hypothetical protein [Candidatus Saccharibacteria bacterium]